MRMTAGGATETGPRPYNQDAFHIDLDLGFAAVADGMGGHRAGEVAARLALEAAAAFIRDTHGGRDITWPFPIDVTQSLSVNRLSAALRLANRRVREAAERDPRHAGMGTTIVAALVEHDRIAIGHVGDSRAYRRHGAGLRQVTEDHTWINAVLGAGGAPADHPMRHVLTNGIGMGHDVAPSMIEETLVRGDRWMLCTDGVHGALDPAAIGEALGSDAAGAAARRLVQRALAAGATDNVTAVVLNVE